MERLGLIEKVKIKMDEYTPEGVSLPFDEIIGPLLDESATELLQKAPLHLITPANIPLLGGDPSSSLVKYANDKAYIPVPSDYVRLYQIKYPLWKKAVRIAISPEHEDYRIQDNEYLSAGYARPVVAIVHDTNSQNAITRYFECGKVLNPGTTALTPVAQYVKKNKPEEIHNSLADALTWLCTSKVFGVLGYGDKAKLTMDQFNQALILTI